ncbi:MAG: response regulator, partial [bacterium]|nr:response regulator [bacterium]
MKRQALVVTGHVDDRETVTRALAEEGFAVRTAADGEEGTALASDSALDLLILDVDLPRKNGFDLCRDLRQRGVDTPIVILSARDQTVD